MGEGQGLPTPPTQWILKRDSKAKRRDQDWGGGQAPPWRKHQIVLDSHQADAGVLRNNGEPAGAVPSMPPEAVTPVTGMACVPNEYQEPVKAKGIEKTDLLWSLILVSWVCLKNEQGRILGVSPRR